MQLDLALYLRLSRTLEGSQGVGQPSTEEHTDVLKSLDRFLLSVQEQTELLRGREAVRTETQSIQVEDIVEEAPAEDAAEPPPIEEAAPAPWMRQHDLLYEDVLWLFKVGDNEGALTSLGRLVLVAFETQELQRFLEINETKLVGLYEKLLGPFDQEFKVLNPSLGDRFFWSADEAQNLLTLAREKPVINDYLEASPLPRMATLALLHRFHTERLISFGEEDQAAVQ